MSTHRYRMVFSKLQATRFISHLDLMRAWERTFRRANIPIVHTQGFHPRPRINLGAALPLGFSSDCELLDFWTTDQKDCDELIGMLQRELPPGLRIEKIEAIPSHEPSLQQEIIASEYIVTLDSSPSRSSLQKKIDHLLNMEEIPRKRRGKNYDLRPLIDFLDLTQEAEKTTIIMRLKAKEAATGRPEEVLLALGIDPYLARIHRMRLILEKEVAEKISS